MNSLNMSRNGNSTIKIITNSFNMTSSGNVTKNKTSGGSFSSASAKIWFLDPVTYYWLPVFNASTTEIWLVSVITLLFALTGLCLYLRVCYIILKHRKSTFMNPFYTVALYLAIPDCAHLFIQVTSGFFITVIGYYSFPISFVMINGLICTICFYTLMCLISLMGINRYIAICHFDKYKVWFSPKRVHVYCCFCLLLGILMTTNDVSCRCFSLKVDFAWKTECQVYSLRQDESPCEQPSILFDETISGFFTVFIPLINCLTIIRYFIKKAKVKIGVAQKSLDKKNVSLLFQFFSISAVFVIYMAIYWVQVSVGLSNNRLDISLTLLAILNSSINPYLYTVFSTEIRSKLLKPATTNVSFVSVKMAPTSTNRDHSSHK